MKVSVVSDEKGRIVSISQFGDIGEKISGIVNAGVVPEHGHKVHEVELSSELQQISLLDLHKGFRMDSAAGQPRLVKL